MIYEVLKVNNPLVCPSIIFIRLFYRDVSVFVLLAPAVGDCPKGDVIFVIDRSGSIGADWPLQVDALKAIVRDFPVGSDDYQFGAVTFSTDAIAEFDLDTYSSADAVRSALDNITYTGGHTNIAAGFFKAREVRQFYKKPKIPGTHLVIF